MPVTAPGPFIRSDMKKAPNSEVAAWIHRFNQMKDADWENRKRGLRNVAAYMNDLVPGYLKNAMRHEDRMEQNFGILLPIIRGHVGNVLMNWFDPRFLAREEDDPIDAVEALNKIYISNKELCNYKASAYQCFLDGYLYRGVESLEIHRPTSNPRTWVIKFVPRRSDMVIFDQNVQGSNISRESKEAFLINYLPPSTMIRLFPNSEDDVLRRFVDDEDYAPAYDTPSTDLYDHIDRQRFGNTYRTVEWLHFEYEKIERQFYFDPKSGDAMEIPKSGYRIGTVEDFVFKTEWAAQRGLELNDDKLINTRDFKPILWTTTFAPDLGIYLENRRDFRQLDGHLPLYAWSFLMKNGVSMGLVDFEWDIIQDFNKREMAKTKIITKSLIVDKPWIHEGAFNGNQDKLREAIDNMTDPSVPLVVPEDAPPLNSENFGVIRGSQVPPSILQDEAFKLQLAERVGMLPPALQGRSERQADSGVAIGRKVIEANVMMKEESESIIQHENDKAEDWALMAIKLYGHPVNRNRVFQSASGKEKVVANELAGFDPIGNEIIRANLSAIKRPKVIITQTKENDYISQARRETAAGALQAMQPSDSNMLTRAAFEYALATNMDTSSDEEKERVLRLANKQMEIVELQADVHIQNLSAQIKGGEPGAPGGGGPEGGGGPPAGPGQPGQPQPPAGRQPVQQMQRQA